MGPDVLWPFWVGHGPRCSAPSPHGREFRAADCCSGDYGLPSGEGADCGSNRVDTRIHCCTLLPVLESIMDTAHVPNIVSVDHSSVRVSPASC